MRVIRFLGQRTQGTRADPAIASVVTLALKSADSDTYLTYVIALAALRVELLPRGARLRLLCPDPHQRSVQPHRATRRQPRDGFPFCLVG